MDIGLLSTEIFIFPKIIKMNTKRAAYEVKSKIKSNSHTKTILLKAAAAVAKNRNFMIVKKDLDAKRKAKS